MATSPSITMSEPSEQPPPLSIEPLASPQEKRDALKLIADSVAQQRQTASRALIFHPIPLSVLTACLAAAHYNSSDISTMLIIFPGIILTYLVAVRYFTSAYIRVAEETKWMDWLKDDIIIGARFGEDIIGAVVMRLEKKAVIRGWTTKTRYRGRGLGSDMLGESVKIAKQKLGRNCVVGFAEDHANSQLPLYTMFNGPFLEREAKANRALAAALKDWEERKDASR